jgi:hypothetical protein
MTSVITKLVYDVASESATARKMANKLAMLAEEYYLDGYLHGEGFNKKERSQPPNTATADATRKYEIEAAEYRQEVEALCKLREAAEGYLSVAA